jgi:Cu2+-exporting ATPase
MGTAIKTPADTSEIASCEHCGTRYRRGSGRGRFCCTGCEYVFNLIRESGLGQYYQLKGQVTAPVGGSAFQPRDYTWLRDVVREVEQSSHSDDVETIVEIQGISCIGCVWLIERVFLKSPGALRLEVHVQTGRTRLLWRRGQFDAEAFAARLQGFGYLIGPPGDKPDTTESARLAKRTGLCAALTMNVMLFMSPFWFGMDWAFEYARLFGWIAFLLATLSLVVGGSHFIVRAWEGLRRGILNIDVPIALGIIAAWIGSTYGFFVSHKDLLYFDFVSSFIFLMLAGRWLQTYAVERNRQRLLGRSAQPDSVSVESEEGRRRMPLSSLREGDRYMIPAGRLVPVDSHLEAEEGAFSLEYITGEADLKVYRKGQYIPAGAAALGRGETCLRAGQTWEASLLRRLTRPAEEGEFRNLLLERIIRWYMPIILVLALVGYLGWLTGTGDATRALAVGIAVLVISCPCALGVAAPLADELAVSRLRALGVYVKTPSIWARLRTLRKVVFDKTGTLTLEYPDVANSELIRELDDASLAALVRLVEQSGHPLSRSLHEHAVVEAGARKLTVPTFPVHEEAGAGVSGRDPQGHLWKLGRADWAAGNSATGATVLVRDGAVVAEFIFRDLLRPDAKEEIRRLRERGLEIAILSGDRPEKVAATARALDLPESAALGGMDPEAKARWVEADGGGVLMLGDGANDSLAFERAACRGTPVVHRGLLESKADFYYLGKGLAGVRELLETADVRNRVVRNVFTTSVIYNVASVSAALAGWINPFIAAFLMPAISVFTLVMVVTGLPQVRRQPPVGEAGRQSTSSI